jgi:hypothetical protein
MVASHHDDMGDPALVVPMGGLGRGTVDEQEAERRGWWAATVVIT